jgi:predicted PurR-regulated permease PerM
MCDRTPTQSLWTTAAAFAVALGALGLIWLLARPLALLVLAVTLAQALAPIVNWLERRVPRRRAVWSVYLLLLGTVAIVVWLTLPAVISEARQLAHRAPELVGQLRGWLGDGAELFGGAARDALLDALANATQTLVSVPFLAVSLLFETLIVVFLSLYFLISGPRLHRFVVSLAPPRRRVRLTRVLARMGRAMGGYVRGVGINAAIIGALTWLGLLGLGVEYPLALAVLTAAGETIPYVGPLLASIPAVLVGLSYSPTTALLVAALYIVIQQTENLVIVPRVMQSQTDVSPALVIFALACGFAAGGLLGALVAIPIAAALRVLVLTVVAPALKGKERDKYTTPEIEEIPT